LILKLKILNTSSNILNKSCKFGPWILKIILMREYEKILTDFYEKNKTSKLVMNEEELGKKDWIENPSGTLKKLN